MKTVVTPKDLAIENTHDRGNVSAWCDARNEYKVDMPIYKCADCGACPNGLPTAYCPDCGALMVNYQLEKAVLTAWLDDRRTIKNDIPAD